MSSGDVMYTAAAASISVGYMIVCLAIIVVSLVGMWKVFVKAGKPGWAAIVPFILPVGDVIWQRPAVPADVCALCEFCFHGSLLLQACEGVWQRRWIWARSAVLQLHLYDDSWIRRCGIHRTAIVTGKSERCSHCIFFQTMVAFFCAL